MTTTFRRIGEEIYKSYEKPVQSEPLGNSNQLAVYLIPSETTISAKDSEGKKITCFTKENKESVLNMFLHSENPQIRLLSCLIVLRTLNQGIFHFIFYYYFSEDVGFYLNLFLADYIHNVFEILRDDLKDDCIKQIFMDYFGTWTILKWCKSNNKVDILVKSVFFKKKFRI